jgi:hypothetical protein
MLEMKKITNSNYKKRKEKKNKIYNKNKKRNEYEIFEAKEQTIGVFA